MKKALIILVILFDLFILFRGIQLRFAELSDAITEAETENAQLTEQLHSYEEQLEQYKQRFSLYEKRLAKLQKLYAYLNAEETEESTEVTKVTEETEVTEVIAQPVQAEPQTEPQKETAQTDTSYYGRLHIPSVGINVALYKGNSQAITDRTDSANIFSNGSYSGKAIADHNNQEFSKLFGVQVGTQGYIELADGGTINIQCIDVLNGYNFGVDIVDEYCVGVMDRADYTMYTCLDSWENVRICLWNKC